MRCLVGFCQQLMNSKPSVLNTWMCWKNSPNAEHKIPQQSHHRVEQFDNHAALPEWEHPPEELGPSPGWPCPVQ